MGQSYSAETPRRLSTEQLSHELGLQFATKCFTHLEIAHFKDNFKTLADHQDGIEYWKEETLCRFLCLPDVLQVGSIIYQMTTYLGAFPFPSLAPCILTREAMVKVVTIMTARYGKVLKRGKRDRIKLLFRSLAVVDRSTATLETDIEKPTMEQLVAEQKPDDMVQSEAAIDQVRSHVAGFTIDEAVDDEDEEDDDDLALAALDSLDAIEVFKQDQKVIREKRMHHAQIPAENLRRFLVLLLLLAPLGPQESLAKYSESLNKTELDAYRNEADAMMAALNPGGFAAKGITYPAFKRAISSSFPLLLEPLNALFEHFLFSKNIDLSRDRNPAQSTSASVSTSTSTSFSPSKRNLIASDTTSQTSILTPAAVAHLSTFLVTRSFPGPPVNVFHAGTSFHPIYATSTHGTSLSSFSRRVMSWRSATLLLVTGTAAGASTISSSTDPTPSAATTTIGAFLPAPWSHQSSSSPKTDSTPVAASDVQPTLFTLSPTHALFPHNPYNRHADSTSHFSTRTGIALGCIIPPSSRSASAHQEPVPGPVSLRIDQDMAKAYFNHDSGQGTGAFLPDPSLEMAQGKQTSSSTSPRNREGGRSDPFFLAKSVELNITALEVFGVVNDDTVGGGGGSGNEHAGGGGGGGGGTETIKSHQERMAWEEREAARRASVNFGSKDPDGARNLLEMAGLVGGATAGPRSGGSV